MTGSHANPTTPLPLSGLRVVDCATFIAAPFAATLLGEFGAEVIKIELPGVGDSLRNFGTKTACGDSLPWLSESRNKKSITLDLRTPEGADLFKRLIAKSDVLCENFQTGTLESWGLGWETLKQVNPRLVMLRVTGYGQTGPNAGKSAGKLAAIGGNKYKGTLTDLENNKTYSGKGSISGGTLTVSGCVLGFLCRSESWARQ